MCLLFVIMVISGVTIGTSEGQLSYDYYKDSCPYVEGILKQEILSLSLVDVTSPSAFLRLMFHDCQVQGCDASILLDSHGLNPDSEMSSSRNFGIRKREAIGYIKSKLEEVCPGQVSCADIIALAAKESVACSGGPQILIPLGRRDSFTCSSKRADVHLPSPMISVDEFLNIFKTQYSMTVEESVAILGAHTIGVGHCINIVGRLYDDPDPDGYEANYSFEALLKLQCPTRIPITNLTSVPNDATAITFDNQYYRDVLAGKGLFAIDTRISRDPRTAPIVSQFAADENYFFQEFSSAFVKMSSSNVLTRNKGEVRKQCNVVNQLG